ncbi:MAG: hypothetical protein JXM70_15905 [Pirellulales bacterium]|nr:hypothetical protein [Pirellulales bacterium]
MRKGLSPGSIYTLKLSRRGHAVPEGLQAAIIAARRAKHLADNSVVIGIITPQQLARMLRENAEIL